METQTEERREEINQEVPPPKKQRVKWNRYRLILFYVMTAKTTTDELGNIVYTKEYDPPRPFEEDTYIGITIKHPRFYKMFEEPDSELEDELHLRDPYMIDQFIYTLCQELCPKEYVIKYANDFLEHSLDVDIYDIDLSKMKIINKDVDWYHTIDVKDYPKLKKEDVIGLPEIKQIPLDKFDKRCGEADTCYEYPEGYPSSSSDSE